MRAPCDPYTGPFFDNTGKQLNDDQLQGRLVRTPEGAEGRIHGFDPAKRWPVVKWADGTHGPTSPMDITLPAYRLYPSEAKDIVEVLRSADSFCTVCAAELCEAMVEKFPEHDWIALLAQAEGEPASP